MSAMSENLTKKIDQLLSRMDGVAASEARTLPFRTFIGPGQIAIEALADHVVGIFVMLEWVPGAVDSDVMAEIQESLTAGQTILLLAPTREVRDHARREILAWYDAVKGVVQ